jgi:iron-sulfur cluster repair protein YtfE (RIC family)
MRNCDEAVSYINHMRAQHRRLEQAIGAIEGRLRMEATMVPELVEQLETLAQEMSHHFQAEEEGGCLEEAVSRLPQLSAKVRQIEEEHPKLQSDVREIIDKAAEIPSDHSAEVRRMFTEFARRLLAHETAENEVLQTAFGCANNGDVDDSNIKTLQNE